MTKEQFLNHVPKMFSNDDFYNLCQSFMNVALNADKFKNKDGGVAGNFHLDDMERASEQVKNYLNKYDISEEDLKSALRLYSHDAIDENDKRQKAFYDQNDYRGNAPAYQVGTLYFFTELPRNVVDKIFSDANAIK